MENIHVERAVFSDPFIIPSAIGAFDPKEKLQKAYGRQHAAHVHFQENIFRLHQSILRNLQEEKRDPSHEIYVLIPRFFMKIAFRK